MPENRGQRVNELCRCHHMKKDHTGLNGHGACGVCDCEYYTFAGWVYKAVLVLSSGDEVLQVLRENLEQRGYDNKVFIVGVDILKTTQLGHITAEVQYAYGQ